MGRMSAIMIGAYARLDEQRKDVFRTIQGLFVYILVESHTKLDVRIGRLFPDCTEGPRLTFGDGFDNGWRKMGTLPE